MPKQIWDFWAPRYHRLWVQRVSLQPTRQAVLKTLSAIGQSLDILDVGCGPGQLYGDIRQAGIKGNYLGIDASDGMIKQALISYPQTAFRVEAMEALREPVEAYDAVICLHALPYAGDPPEALRRMTQSLKPGGHLLIACAASLSRYDRFILRLVKLTTSPAVYPDFRTMNRYTAGLPLTEPVVTRLTAWPMPALCLWHWRKEGAR